MAAGFLGASIAAGWALGELLSANASRPTTARRVVLTGPVVMAVGLGMAAATQRAGAGGWAITGWLFALLFAGIGIGLAWPHLATSAMSSVGDRPHADADAAGVEAGGDKDDKGDEGDKASAAVNTVQLVANAFGAALSGVAVNLGAPDTARSATYLYGSFAVLALVGLVTAARGLAPVRRTTNLPRDRSER